MQDSTPPKAYYNREFLSSPDARAIRILCEFQEPFTRLLRKKVKSTIVFFGSSRVKPEPLLQAEIADLEKQIARDGDPDGSLSKILKQRKKLLPMTKYYEEARELARLITEWSMTLDNGLEFIICSGGGGGIMEAANRGAREAGGKTIGFNISLPMEQKPNQHISPEFNFEFHYFFMRKFWFLILSRALVIFPGGFGTMDELMEVLTLVQTEKVEPAFPIILYGSSYWKAVINFDRLLEAGVIEDDDLNIFKFCDSPQEAFEYLKQKLVTDAKWEQETVDETNGNE